MSSLRLDVVVVAVAKVESESLRRVAERGRKAFAKNCPKRLRGRVNDSKASSSGSGSGTTVDFHNIRSHLIGRVQSRVLLHPDTITKTYQLGTRFLWEES